MDMSEVITWKDVVREALEELGQRAHLKKIYAKIEGHEKTRTNPTWRATVRRTLQQYRIFYQEEKGTGVWLLREEKPPQPFDPEKNPQPKHADVQGMLLELGKIYGYETAIPPYDRQEKFMGKTLWEIATLEDFPEFSYENIVDTAKLIDVIWFEGDRDLFPKYAFEVEHTSKFTKGLTRLSELHRAQRDVALFILTPANRVDKFHKEIDKGPFQKIKNTCNVRTYDRLVDLYPLALQHHKSRNNFLGKRTAY